MHLTDHLRRQDYVRLFAHIAEMSHAEMTATLRDLYRNDLYALLRYGMNRVDMEAVANPDWLLDRCREVQANPDGYIDLWAREHFKSSIITTGLTIQTILKGYGEGSDWTEPTICLFSHTRPIAKDFLRQIRSELTNNAILKELFQDIFYENPSRDSPRWSDEGLVFKRRTNPKEACLEAWGLVDSMPTGMHFSHLIYDDVVTLASVSNAEQIQKTTEAWEMSLNLGSGEDTKKRIIGTRYHFNDTYGQIIKRTAAVPRVYPASVDGTVTGEPVLRSREFLANRYRDMGQYVYSSQMLLNPVADSTQGFQRSWLKYFDDVDQSRHMNKYVLVDPASQKKARSDWTAIAVIGLGPDENIYLLDAVRDRLNLTERGAAVMRMHRKHRPKVVGYERYGMQADIEYLREVQKRENYRFEVVEVGGTMPKTDRIRRLIPFFESGRFFLPDSLYKTIYDKSTVNIIEELVESEMMGFPVSLHDDLLDAISRIFDLNMVWPKSVVSEPVKERYVVKRRRSWMA